MDKKLKEAAAVLKSKDFQHAYELSDSILMFNAMNYKALLIHGQALVGLERFPEAQEVFQRAIENDTSPVMAYYGLSQVYKQLKQTNKQLDCLTKVLDLQQYFQGAIEALKCCQRLKQYDLGCKLANKVLNEYTLNKKQEKQVYSILYFIQKDKGSVDVPVYLKMLLFKEPVHLEFFNHIIRHFHEYANKSYYLDILRKLTDQAKLKPGYEFFSQFDTAPFAFNPIESSDDQLLSKLINFPISSSPISPIHSKFMQLFKSPEDLEILEEFISISESYINRNNHVIQLFVIFILFAFEQYGLIIEYAPSIFNTLSNNQSKYGIDLVPFFQFLLNILIGCSLYEEVDEFIFTNILEYKDLLDPHLISLLEYKYALETKETKIALPDLVISNYHPILHPVILLQQAKCLVSKSEYSAAISLLSSHLDSPDPSFLFLYLECQFHLEQYAQLLITCTSIITNPEHPANEHPRIYFYLGRCFLKSKNDPIKAIKCFIKSIDLELQTDVVITMSELLLLHTPIVNNLILKIPISQIISILLNTITMSPNIPIIHHLLIIIYSHVNNHNKAIIYCQSYLNIKNSIVVHEYLANAYYNIGNYNSSLLIYQKLQNSTKITPNSADYYNYRICINMHHLQMYSDLFPLLNTLLNTTNTMDESSILSLYYLAQHGHVQYLQNNNKITHSITTVMDLIQFTIALDTSIITASTYASLLSILAACFGLILNFHEFVNKQQILQIVNIKHSKHDKALSELLDTLNIPDLPIYELMLLCLIKQSADFETIAIALNLLHSTNIPLNEILIDKIQLSLYAKHKNPLQLAHHFQLTNKLELAQHYFISAISQSPNIGLPWLYLGLFYQLHASTAPLAMPCFLKARDIQPHVYDYWIHIAHQQPLAKMIPMLLHVINREFNWSAYQLLLNKLFLEKQIINANKREIGMKIRQFNSVYGSSNGVVQMLMIRYCDLPQEALEMTKNSTNNNKPYVVLIKVFNLIQSGNNKLALQEIKQILSSTMEVQGDVLTCICKLLVKMGNINMAWDLINQYKHNDTSHVDTAVSNLVKSLLSANASNAAIYKSLFMNPIANLKTWVDHQNEHNYTKDQIIGNCVVKQIQHYKGHIIRKDGLKYQFMMPTDLLDTNTSSDIRKISKLQPNDQISQLLLILNKGNGYWRIYVMLYKLMIKNGYKKSSLLLVNELPPIWRMWHHMFIDVDFKRTLAILNQIDLVDENGMKTMKETLIKYLSNEAKEGDDENLLDIVIRFMKLYEKDMETGIAYIHKQDKEHHRIKMILETLE